MKQKLLISLLLVGSASQVQAVDGSDNSTVDKVSMFTAIVDYTKATLSDSLVKFNEYSTVTYPAATLAVLVAAYRSSSLVRGAVNTVLGVETQEAQEVDNN